MPTELADWRIRPTITVDEASAILGIARSTAYDAVKRHQIPTVKIGRRLLVPTARFRALLGETVNGDEARAANADLVENATGTSGHGTHYRS